MRSRLRLAGWCCALAVVAGGWAAPVAVAGTLTVEWAPAQEDAEYDVPTIVFRAATGERNRMVLEQSATRIDIRDAHPIEIVMRERADGPRLPACRRISAERLTCPTTSEAADHRVLLGDRDDRFLGRGGFGVSVAGENGDDVLRGRRLSGGPGRDLVVGSRGIDFLTGGDGRDVVRGGGGDDAVCGDCGRSGPSRDVIDGGPGREEVRIDGPGRIRVDLADRRPDGVVGAGDVLRNIEAVRAWSDRDMVLLGNGGPNTLIAEGPGVARVDGRAGADALLGGAGDRLSGGDGRDRVVAQVDDSSAPGADRPARLHGGRGEDYLAGTDASVLDCGPGDDATRTPRFGELRPWRLDIACEFYSDESFGEDALKDPLWVGRDLRVVDDALHVPLKWRRTAPTTFVAEVTGSGPTHGVVFAAARGTLRPGVTRVRMPFTRAGRRQGVGRSGTQFLDIAPATRPASWAFTSWLRLAPAGIAGAGAR